MKKMNSNYKSNGFRFDETSQSKNKIEYVSDEINLFLLLDE